MYLEIAGFNLSKTKQTISCLLGFTR